MRAPLAVASLQKGLYDRITGDLTISVYCPVAPDTATLPLVVIPDFSLADFSTKTEDTWRITYTLSVWSAMEKSFDELTTLCSNVGEAIMRDNLTLANSFKEVNTTLQSFTCRSEQIAIGLAQHGTMIIVSIVQDLLS
jgi:hypothetical protein